MIRLLKRCSGAGLGYLHMLSRMRSYGVALVLAGGVLIAACNALVDTSADQCETDSDCQKLGGALANSVCTPDKVCSHGGDCTTNQQCLDRFGGNPAICRQPDGTCVKLLTDDCQEVYPTDVLADDDTIVLGFMGPLKDEFASNGVPQWEGIQLAVNEFETFAKGLPVAGSTERRHVAVLACHDIDNPIGVAEHLVNTVRVPAIFGPAFSGITLDVATQVTVPKGTLIMSSSATSPAITDLDDNGLVWRTCPSDALQAVPLNFLVADEENTIRSDLGLTSSDPIRLAMAVKGDAYGKGLADAVLANLREKKVCGRRLVEALHARGVVLAADRQRDGVVVHLAAVLLRVPNLAVQQARVVVVPEAHQLVVSFG